MNRTIVVLTIFPLTAIAVACSSPQVPMDAPGNDGAVVDPDTTAPSTEPYGNCSLGQCGARLDCVPFTSASGSGQACVPACDRALSGADCPPSAESPTTGRSCIIVDPGRVRCFLNCRTTSQCPAGMTCAGGFWCVWPR